MKHHYLDEQRRSWYKTAKIEEKVIQVRETEEKKSSRAIPDTSFNVCAR